MKNKVSFSDEHFPVSIAEKPRQNRGGLLRYVSRCCQASMGPDNDSTCPNCNKQTSIILK